MDIQEAIAQLKSAPLRGLVGRTTIEAFDMAIDALALMEKREQGLVVELPCAVGDIVYYVGKRCTYRNDCPRQEWYEIFGDFGERCPDMGSDECDNCGVHEVMFSFSNMGSMLGQVGKIVFLTRADAERMVKR